MPTTRAGMVEAILSHRYRVIIPQCFGHTELRSRLKRLVARGGGMVVVARRGRIRASPTPTTKRIENLIDNGASGIGDRFEPKDTLQTAPQRKVTGKLDTP
jgi:hypothetical protein